jgi:hypothetical protein
MPVINVEFEISHPSISQAKLEHSPVVDMDFSSFNSAEQAHMTKVIEKRQVSTLSQFLSPPHFK